LRRAAGGEFYPCARQVRDGAGIRVLIATAIKTLAHAAEARKMRGRGCIVSAGAAPLARVLMLASTVLLAGCDLLQDATKDPWQGYAWQKEENRFECLCDRSRFPLDLP
jgi:hypothetical protein